MILINKNSAPKTNDEKIVANIKKILEISVESAHDFELIPNGVLSLASRLYKDVKEGNELYRRTLNALGVPNVWYNEGEKLVAEAVDRAVQIKKYEKVYNALCVMGRQIETIRNCVDELQTVASPLLKATEDAGKFTDEKPADILVF